jgi:uncharacterized protein (TIGR02265 family)
MQQPERLLFDTAFVSIMKSMPDNARLLLTARWKALGVDLSKMLPGYPFELWCRCIEEAATFLQGTRAERHRQLGRSLVSNFSESFMGRAIAPLARLHGTQRSLERAPTLFSQTNNYMQAKVELNEPKHVKIRVNEVSPIPDLLAGSIEEMVLFTGGQEPKVVFEQGAMDTVYDVRWA